MNSVFLDILGISTTAAFVSLIVLLIRIFLKGAPRWITCLLWAMVALRLLCPVLPESKVSFIPDESYNLLVTAEYKNAHNPVQPEVENFFNESGYVVHNSAEAESWSDDAVDTSYSLVDICSFVWCGGAAGMLIYGAVSYIRMKLRFRDAVLYKGNIRQSEKVDSPFVLGIIKPCIYIPFTLERKTRKQVVMHEQAHIKRLDHIWKPLGYVLVCVHWFNPLIWISYVLFCRDVEVACDEKVIKNYRINQKKNYAMALLKCKISPRVRCVNALAFGEISVGARIKKTLRYKKPAEIIAFFSMALTLSLSLCLLTNPVSAAQPYKIRNYYEDRVTSDYGLLTEEVQTEPTEPETEYYEEETEEYYYYNNDATYDEYKLLELAVEPIKIEPFYDSYRYNTSTKKHTNAFSVASKNNIINQEPIYLFYEPNIFPWNTAIPW